MFLGLGHFLDDFLASVFSLLSFCISPLENWNCLTGHPYFCCFFLSPISLSLCSILGWDFLKFSCNPIIKPFLLLYFYFPRPISCFNDLFFKYHFLLFHSYSNLPEDIIEMWVFGIVFSQHNLSFPPISIFLVFNLYYSSDFYQLSGNPWLCLKVCHYKSVETASRLGVA